VFFGTSSKKPGETSKHHQKSRRWRSVDNSHNEGNGERDSRQGDDELKGRVRRKGKKNSGYRGFPKRRVNRKKEYVKEMGYS